MASTLKSHQIKFEGGEVTTSRGFVVSKAHAVVVLDSLERLIDLADFQQKIEVRSGFTDVFKSIFNFSSSSQQKQRALEVIAAQQALEVLVADETSKGRPLFFGEVEELMQKLLPDTPVNADTAQACQTRISTMHIVRDVLREDGAGYSLEATNFARMRTQIAEPKVRTTLIIGSKVMVFMMPYLFLLVS